MGASSEHLADKFQRSHSSGIIFWPTETDSLELQQEAHLYLQKHLKFFLESNFRAVKSLKTKRENEATWQVRLYGLNGKSDVLGFSYIMRGAQIWFVFPASFSHFDIDARDQRHLEDSLPVEFEGRACRLNRYRLSINSEYILGTIFPLNSLPGDERRSWVQIPLDQYKEGYDFIIQTFVEKTLRPVEAVRAEKRRNRGRPIVGPIPAVCPH